MANAHKENNWKMNLKSNVKEFPKNCNFREIGKNSLFLTPVA